MPLQLRTARQSRHELLVAEWSLWSCHFGPFAHCLQQPPKQAGTKRRLEAEWDCVAHI
jgi:hypothetical protein